MLNPAASHGYMRTIPTAPLRQRSDATWELRWRAGAHFPRKGRSVGLAVMCRVCYCDTFDLCYACHTGESTTPASMGDQACLLLAFYGFLFGHKVVS